MIFSLMQRMYLKILTFTMHLTVISLVAFKYFTKVPILRKFSMIRFFIFRECREDGTVGVMGEEEAGLASTSRCPLTS